MSNVKEIWIYHHSHLDVGYTHPQPVLWELQLQYLNQAIELCERTEHEPEKAKFRWTCEATAPVMKWLEASSPDKVERFAKFVRNGQICLTAAKMHTTPLCGADQLARMFYPVKKLREQFGAKLNTAINHDINGQPWTFAQIMLDAGIELYTTGVNIHFGGIPLPRPRAFRWQAPDGRELLTFNGEHYSIFTQFCHLWDQDLAKMKKGIDTYLQRLEREQYPYDFIYISSTNFPLFDNTPPDEELLEIVRRWNEAGLGPRIRLATPEMLLEKLKSLPREEIPVVAGDWTDYWNFGAASSAEETRLTRRAKQSLKTAELLSAFQGTDDERERELYREAWEQLDLYDEHTWGANVSVTDPDSRFTKTLWMHKAHPAYQANSLSGYLLAKQLERLAGNPLQSGKPEGVLLVNATQVPQKLDVRVSEEFTYEGRHVAANRFKFQQNNSDTDWTAPAIGTVELAPFSWKKVPYANMKRMLQETVRITETAIETAYYVLEFDPATGRIRQLYDKLRDWPIVDPHSEWTLFQYVQERVDGLKMPEHRTTLFPRDVEKCNDSISCWNHEWPALRRGAERLTACRVDRHDSGATLVLRWEAPGVEWLEQRITLFAASPRIELIASFYKQDVRTPESVYFAFPLHLREWTAKFDSAGTYVELDREQLPASCKDWVTVDQVVSIYDEEHGVTLACPDAPLVQIGGFHFGKEQREIPRNPRPLLLAWPVNNYWDTNFRASQPGVITVKYELTSFSKYRVEDAHAAAVEAGCPVQLYPAVNCPAEESGVWIEINNPLVVVQGCKPAEDGEGIILRLMNLSEQAEQAVEITFPGRAIRAAALTDMLETAIGRLEPQGSAVGFTVPARRLVTLRVQL
ncbi:hypothetical protein PACILC2_04300 [Paenibacillus cisolokensis]|uniref:Glycoside hydrolase family 38 N-terminal domain-containing protein n=1 Tax=Paenibacillus cisolokensis TaxID=1658519 RepID=A0ABQ4N111_9BACL|nr:glycosyl hydrolase-related protein [Paenibacillus cisolokensis]GIQ61862.1 hypothetical protein PACILC2_04300 [Paenibacillus cisolokensis]